MTIRSKNCGPLDPQLATPMFTARPRLDLPDVVRGAICSQQQLWTKVMISEIWKS